MQDICFPFYKLNGLCNYIFYFCLKTKHNKSKPFIHLSLCLCPIWEYQCLFLDTYNARLSKLSIDYAWSGCIIQSKPSKLPDEWNKYCNNHEYFMVNRKLSLTIRNQPIDAFALGVKNLPINPYVPENILKQIKKDWCNPPEGFESALNWKAYDSDYFIKENFWPCKDSDLWVPSHGSY